MNKFIIGYLNSVNIQYKNVLNQNIYTSVLCVSYFNANIDNYFAYNLTYMVDNYIQFDDIL